MAAPNPEPQLTGIAFLLRITNPSARIIINLVNFLHNIFSISSACLMAILSRIELTDGSIRTRSDSFRETVSGWRRTSGDALWYQLGIRREGFQLRMKQCKKQLLPVPFPAPARSDQ